MRSPQWDGDLLGAGSPVSGTGPCGGMGFVGERGPSRRGAHGAVRGAGCPFRRVLMGNGAVRGDRAPKKAGGGIQGVANGVVDGVGAGGERGPARSG